MAIDMLRLADEGEGTRSGFFADGETSAPPVRRTSVPLSSIDMRALVARAVVPRLHASLRARGTLARQPALTLPATPRLDPGHGNPGHGDPGHGNPGHGTPGHGDIAQDLDERGRDAVDGLIDRLLADDVAGACGHIDGIRACGRSLERIYVELLTPAAVRLGRLIADDVCSAAAGTIAFCNLHLVLRRYAPDFYGERRAHGRGAFGGGGRVLLVSPTAGAEALRGVQVFGLLLAADFLRREGWNAWTERSFRSPSFREAVLTQCFDLVEILAGDDDDLDEIASGVRTLRRDGINPRAGIVACGRIFVDKPDYVRLVGADHGVSDPLSILPHLAQLAGRQLRRSS